LTITESEPRRAKARRFVAGVAIHPGESLLEDYLKPLEISQNRLAVAMRVPPIRVSEIVNGRRAITPDTALRLAACLGTTPEFWLNLQSAYDLAAARQASKDQYLDLKPLVAAG
jgi:antitoxin HigA-1